MASTSLEKREREPGQLVKEIHPQGAHRPVGRPVGAECRQPGQARPQKIQPANYPEGLQELGDIGAARPRQDEIDGPAHQLGGQQDGGVSEQGGEEDAGQRRPMPPDVGEEPPQSAAFFHDAASSLLFWELQMAR